MRNNSFFKQILLLLTLFVFASCDKDYNEIGGDLIGDNNFDFKSEIFNVVAYNQKIGPIQSNNLAVNGLGIYKNDAFGTTTANFATQVVLSSPNPTIGLNPEIESVVLTVPYFSTLIKTNTNGSHEYELDSIYGVDKAKIKLSVYESGYYMRDIDASLDDQKYYTNQDVYFDDAKVGNRLNDFESTENEQNDKFFFDSAEHKTEIIDATTKETIITRTVPGMQLNLNKSVFESKILEAEAGKLATNDVFKDYFRGLYFKVEKVDGSEGSMAMMNFAKGKITINYKEDLTSNGATTRVDKSIILNLTGNSVSLLNQSNENASYTDAMSSSNTSLGDEKLYLKGGEGSLSVIALFGGDADNNGVADELETIRKNGWLINEANLVFNIDASSMSNSYEPNRIYLYDLNNNRPIVDYYNDITINKDPKKSKAIFDGIITKEAVTDGRGLTYKIRITNHIKNLIKNADSTNVKLGLVVTEDISTSASYKLKTPNTIISQAPKASVMNPLGTILYGNKIPFGDPNYDKRLKLEIYYTKPN